jgi:hypothetical protein
MSVAGLVQLIRENLSSIETSAGSPVPPSLGKRVLVASEMLLRDDGDEVGPSSFRRARAAAVTACIRIHCRATR